MYRIFWNKKQPCFWVYHKKFCEKFNITNDVTVNYTTDCELSGIQIASFKKAIESGFTRIVKI